MKKNDLRRSLFIQPALLMLKAPARFPNIPVQTISCLQTTCHGGGWISGNAKDLYNLAVEESFRVYGGRAGYADYMLQDGVNFDQALDKIERILEQKMAFTEYDQRFRGLE